MCLSVQLICLQGQLLRPLTIEPEQGRDGHPPSRTRCPRAARGARPNMIKEPGPVLPSCLPHATHVQCLCWSRHYSEVDDVILKQKYQTGYVYKKKEGDSKGLRMGDSRSGLVLLVDQTGGKLTWWRGQRVKSKPQTASESIKKEPINKYPLTLKGK